MTEPGPLEARAREISQLILCSPAGAGGLDDLAADPALAEEVAARLDACGLQLHRSRAHGRWLAATAPDLRDAATHGLSEPQLAALGALYVSLEIAPEPGPDTKARLAVTEFCEQFAAPRGWQAAHVRRTILGPLEAHGYIRVTQPQGSRRAAVIAAGPRMALLDRRRIIRGLERCADAQDAA